MVSNKLPIFQQPISHHRTPFRTFQANPSLLVALSVSNPKIREMTSLKTSKDPKKKKALSKSTSISSKCPPNSKSSMASSAKTPTSKPKPDPLSKKLISAKSGFCLPPKPKVGKASISLRGAATLPHIPSLTEILPRESTDSSASDQPLTLEQLTATTSEPPSNLAIAPIRKNSRRLSELSTSFKSAPQLATLTRPPSDVSTSTQNSHSKSSQNVKERVHKQAAPSPRLNRQPQSPKQSPRLSIYQNHTIYRATSKSSLIQAQLAKSVLSDRSRPPIKALDRPQIPKLPLRRGQSPAMSPAPSQLKSSLMRSATYTPRLAASTGRPRLRPSPSPGLPRPVPPPHYRSSFTTQLEHKFARSSGSVRWDASLEPSMSRLNSIYMPRTGGLQLSGHRELDQYGDRFIPGFKKGKELGKGGCAVVWSAVDSAGNEVAVKQVVKGASHKHVGDVMSARREIKFGTCLFKNGQPLPIVAGWPGIQNITRLVSYYETRQDVFLVMEKAGPSFTKHLFEIKGEFVKGERVYRVHHQPLYIAMKNDLFLVKKFLHEVLEALHLLHQCNIVHSDLKPDNILVNYDARTSDLEVKLIDFGSAYSYGSGEHMGMATPEYMPPEGLQCSDSAPALTHRQKQSEVPPSCDTDNVPPYAFDMWSLGAILLEMSVGFPLWMSYKARVVEGEKSWTNTGLFATATKDNKKIASKQWQVVQDLPYVLSRFPGLPLQYDDEGVHFLEGLLQWHPADRLSPLEALQHPWMQVFET
eukprot:Platyproteum_vivax@DN6685_c0_g1_i1.p1